MSSASAIEQGWQYHRTGQFADAARVFRQILDADPNNAEIHHLHGLASFRQGVFADAERSYRHAIALRPTYAEAHSNLGILLAIQGRREEAVTSFRHAISAKPQFADAHNNLGIALREIGDSAEALASFREAIRWDADHVDALRNLGSLLVDRLEARPALEHLQRLNRIRPNTLEHMLLLGAALSQLEKFEEAAEQFAAAVDLHFHSPEARNGLGIALAGQRRFEEAVVSFRKALELRSSYPEVYNNIGNSLRNLGKLEESKAAYDEAIRLRPDYAEAFNNLGITLALQGELQGAIDSYGMAAQLVPNHADAHKNRAMILLKIGDFRAGWEEFEWRWKCKDFPRRSFAAPPWRGEPLAGKTILLHAEQGLGDTLQFIRYAAEIKNQGARVLVECQANLIALLKTCEGIDQLLPQGAPFPPHDFQLPFMSLPRVLETSLETIPARVPYVLADTGRIEDWKNELSRFDGYRVGIAWQGNPKHIGDRTRSFPLRLLEPLANISGVQLLSLQKGPGAEQLEAQDLGFRVHDLGRSLDTGPDAFLDTAAVMKNLDLVVTADTSTAHLAGALGVPAWVALQFAADFRWLMQRDDNPWYPSVRLFRQERPDDWQPVFQKMSKELRFLADKQRKSRPISIAISPGELIGRIVDLELRIEQRAVDEDLSKDRKELLELEWKREDALINAEATAALWDELRALVRERTEVEREIRRPDQGAEVTCRLVELAGSLLRIDDRRAAITREINSDLNWLG
jgi:Flp pilus assembly protein TadD